MWTFEISKAVMNYWSLNIPFCASGQSLLPVAHLKPQQPPTNSILLSASCFIKTGCTLLSFLIPASFTGCMVWREHPWQSSSPALRVLLPLIALNFPSLSYPFFGYSFNSSLTTSIHYASLWLLLFFFFSLHYWLLFFFHQSWPLLPTIRTIHWSPDTWSPFTEPQTCCSLSLEAPTPPSPHLPANCYSFSTSQDRHNFPSWVFVLMTFSWDLTPLPLPP